MERAYQARKVLYATCLRTKQKNNQALSFVNASTTYPAYYLLNRQSQHQAKLGTRTSQSCNGNLSSNLSQITSEEPPTKSSGPQPPSPLLPTQPALPASLGRQTPPLPPPHSPSLALTRSQLPPPPLQHPFHTRMPLRDHHPKRNRRPSG
jgi:hypothetical protein